MPLPIPNLDDRTFDDLVKELRNRIPTLTDKWTDFNISDPGIMTLELLAYLGEMVMYRINRITERSRNNFLKLLLDPATPVTVDVTFTLLTPPSLLTPPMEYVVIPLGTVFAALDVSGQEFLFETIEEGRISNEILLPSTEFSTIVQARNLAVILNKDLGVSDGKADQIFSLPETPVLLDGDHISHPVYNPNPKIIVGGDIDWQFRIDLLNSLPSDKHFTVDPLTGNVRFGDDIRGKIPPKDAAIVCQKYQKILGSEARVLAGEISELRSEIPGVPQSEVLVFNESDANGGINVFDISEGLSSGLKLYKETFRATTVSDYEYLVKEIFNREYASRPDQERVARVKCLPQSNQDAIYLMIIPDPLSLAYLPPLIESPPDDFVEYPQPSEQLLQRVLSFLQERRLLTVRLFVEGPTYQEVQIDIVLARKENTNRKIVKGTVENEIIEYFAPITGGPDKTGWPFGRSLYKSELYQIIERIEGVEYVENISLSTIDEISGNTNNYEAEIEIGERNLIKISMLNVTTKP